MGTKTLRRNIEKRSLECIGHVLRMKNDRGIKAAILGSLRTLNIIIIIIMNIIIIFIIDGID